LLCGGEKMTRRKGNHFRVMGGEGGGRGLTGSKVEENTRGKRKKGGDVPVAEAKELLRPLRIERVGGNFPGSEKKRLPPFLPLKKKKKKKKKKRRK